MSDNLSHRDLLRCSGENEPAIPSGDAFHDAQVPQVNHDLLKESPGNIVFLGDLSNRDWSLAVMLN